VVFPPAQHGCSAFILGGSLVILILASKWQSRDRQVLNVSVVLGCRYRRGDGAEWVAFTADCVVEDATI